MFIFNTVITETDPGLDSMTEAWRAPLCGQTKRLVVLGSGLQDNPTTGKTKTAFTLLAPGMVTLGMMCLVITATTTLVLQVSRVLLDIKRKLSWMKKKMLRVTVLRAPRGAFGFQSECLESKKTIVRFANLLVGESLMFYFKLNSQFCRKPFYVG